MHIEPTKRIWQGIPGIEKTAKGRLFVTWFSGGAKEPEPENTIYLCTSDDGGQTFAEPAAVVLPTGQARTFDPTLWIDPAGKLWLIINRGDEKTGVHGVHARICAEPNAPIPVWGEEFSLGLDTPYSFRMNKPTVLSSGEWVMPVTHCSEKILAWFAQEKQRQGVAISKDEGKTWSLHGSLEAPAWALENMIVERRNGSLWMLIRTGGGFLWESESTDRGCTWSEAVATTIANPGSRFFIRRLRSGTLLLVNHYKFERRSHLTARLSTDEGHSWSEGLLLDERAGVSYPDGIEDMEGLIQVVYDRNRGCEGDILMASFTEADVAAGADVSGKVVLKQVVNTLESTKHLLISTNEHPRSSIYYWKCDRPAAYHGTAERDARPDIEQMIRTELAARFPAQPLTVFPAGGQGNHITFRATIGDESAFVRIDDGDDHDDYIQVESHLLGEVRALGVPTPRVLAVDASRARVPFAWQVLEDIPHPDLNTYFKSGALDVAAVAHGIGSAVARWQAIQPGGFGPFDGEVLRSTGHLTGYHEHYADYFHLHLERHLGFLTERGFLSADESAEIGAEIALHHSLLTIERGCLVHKDLALWNILGSGDHIAALIDFDDAISGDPMDDLSLLACFHDAAFLRDAFQGYQGIRPLPPEHLRRFWLHLLRNMIVKAVIRVGAGYFDRGNSFFLIPSGATGGSLREFTRARLNAALTGLRNETSIENL